ncbi:EEV glycoprotein [Tanapox virus]|uniref:Protein OPG161 n=1 Tax=Tanapox virus TaxID=99000 RepID=A7XCQ6_9POXV|nr:EEV glycoprotein [Tanapox virus]ABQ43753.1 EEV glycoprotein [Tanapox virus]
MVDEMTSVNLDIEGDKLNSNENTNAFTGSTIYGSKLKKGKNTKSKKNKFFGLCIRISIIISILSLMAITITLSLQVNKYKSMVELNKDLNDASVYLSNAECRGLVYGNNCFIFNSEPKTFDEALRDCNTKNYFLPPTNIMNSWLSDYLEDTWSEEGTSLLKSNIEFNSDDIDISTEMRKYFCVKSF